MLRYALRGGRIPSRILPAAMQPTDELRMNTAFKEGSAASRQSPLIDATSITKQQERNMTQTNTMRNLITASALGAVTAIIMFAQAGQASAASGVLGCEGSSRRAVVECCQQQVKKHGMPMWMRQAGAACNSRIVKCTGGTAGIAANKRCWISQTSLDYDKGDKDKGDRGNKR
jgi:hypothetical protein